MCRCENDEGEPRCYRGLKSDAYCTLSGLERQLSEIDARCSASTADLADDCIVVRRTTEFVCGGDDSVDYQVRTDHSLAEYQYRCEYLQKTPNT